MAKSRLKLPVLSSIYRYLFRCLLLAHVNCFVPVCRERTLVRQQRGLPALVAITGGDDARTKPLTVSNPQVVAIVGAGAVGTYYGARLWQAGHDVHFYLRGANYDAAQANGLTVKSVEGDVHIPIDALQAYNCTTTMASYIAPKLVDWVIVALKSTALEAIPTLILPLLDHPSKNARVLIIMNGMIEEDLLRMMRLQSGQSTALEETSYVISGTPPPPLRCCRAWYGGMALICCNRIAPAVVDHTYFGLLSAGVASTRSSCLQDKEDDRHTFQALFAPTIVDVTYEDSLVRGRWKKMLWNLPFNGLSVAMGGITVDQIVSDPSLRRLAYAIMDETIATANAELALLRQTHGTNTSTGSTTSRGGDKILSPLDTLDRAAMMKLSDDMGPYKPSTMLDFIHKRGMEVHYLFRTPVTRAQQLGVPVPHLETIVAQIEAYQRFYNLY